MQLRSGNSRVAIAAGSNLLLDPVDYVSMSKLEMLSPEGRSRMWDKGANGYARGEGVAAVVLKTLKDAEADGDYIECVIRETATNQDGRTPGITVYVLCPSNYAAWTFMLTIHVTLTGRTPSLRRSLCGTAMLALD